MTTLQNEFSWSFSRHELFQTCLKRYYFAYYASWGGWDPAAPPFLRELYRLKRLTTRHAWAGHHTHQALEHLIRQARHIPPDSLEAVANAVITREIEAMRREFRDSRAGNAAADPAHLIGLFEHEYRLNVPPEEWKAMADRVETAIRNFIRSPAWRDIQAAPDDDILAVETRAAFLIDGLKVYAIPDFIRRAPDASIIIHDWKTGQTPLEKHRMQLGVYTLFACDHWACPPTSVRALAYNPVLDTSEEFSFSAVDLDNLKEFIRDSADEMLFPLDDPEHNLAGDGSGFDCTDTDTPCATCPFLRVCPRWNKT